jgi:UDP-N-acetylglucosamine--N-acetylmuramyl-(pentapeptide) pyrophosphoryl-undecaprenol N-acetylglucosamine transferase
MSVVKKDAALMIKESELESFEDVLLGIVDNPGKRKELSENIKKLALPDATRRIADEVEKIVK